LMGLFISFASSSLASWFFILLKCNVCCGSHSISSLLYPLINTMTLSWVYSICKTMTKTCKKDAALQVCTTLHDKHQERQEGRGVDSGVHVMLQVQTCSSCNHSISSMPQPNTSIVPNKPVTLLCNHLFFYITWSWVPSTQS
jgi:hypothetical protein